jgi:hypothetical protein
MNSPRTFHVKSFGCQMNDLTWNVRGEFIARL